MAPDQSLALHLQQATAQHARQLALHTSDRTWSFAELLDDTYNLADPEKSSNEVLIASGSSLDLARHAYACSFENRPFWPVHRSIQTNPVICPYPDAALIISTSGSEGTPRAVVLGNRQMDIAAGLANKTLDLHPGDLWLNCLPLFHIGGQSILWRCAKAGAGVFLIDGFVQERVIATLASHPVTHLSLVPAMLASLLEQGVKPPASLRVALIGGAALSPQLYDRATQSGWPLYPSYGMSESTAQLATFTPQDGKWHAGCVGKPMPSHEIRIGDDGRISIRGPQVMLGYLNTPQRNDTDWLLTGDLGSLDHDGRLTITGRADDMLISGGRNVHPLEIESCLAACPGVSEVAVSGRPDPVWGDLIVAILVGKAAENTLRAHAKNTLHSAAQPRKYIFVDALPKTPAGKPDRAKIRQLAMQSAG